MSYQKVKSIIKFSQNTFKYKMHKKTEKKTFFMYIQGESPRLIKTLNLNITYNLNRILMKFSENTYMDVVRKKIKKFWNGSAFWGSGTTWESTNSGGEIDNVLKFTRPHRGAYQNDQRQKIYYHPKSFLIVFYTLECPNHAKFGLIFLLLEKHKI